MADNGSQAESVTKTEGKTEGESSTSLFGHVNSSTPSRLFGQFKQNGTGFNSFGQFSATEQTSPSTTSYFTSTLSKFTSISSGAGFGASSSTSLAASLAPLSANKELFGSSANSSTEMKTSKDETPDNNEDDDNDEDGNDDANNNVEEEDEKDEQNQSTPSLLETAAEYEARRASTHPMATIQGDTSTGEEHEVSKFQMAGKLFMYNADQQQFVERGYGILKINESHDPSDWNILHVRIIMRLDKSFRVILNSPIFPKMTVERASDRSVRFGAQDDSHLRVFVIKASSNDCTNLCKELESRIQIIERQQTASSNAQSPAKDKAESSPTTNPLPTRIRKRCDSDASDHSNDLSKKSKLVEGYRDEHKNATDDEDSVDSVKTGEQETTS